jgi:hypothetical protein
MLSKNINNNNNKEKLNTSNLDIDIYNFSMFNYDEKNFIPKKEFYQTYFGKNKIK